MNDILSMELKKQLELAKESSNSDIHSLFLGSRDMIVRRALARNPYISKLIANKLAIDPVLNVSYMALKNPNCTITRTFREKTFSDCVLCMHDEREIDCTICEQKKRANF